MYAARLLAKKDVRVLEESMTNLTFHNLSTTQLTKEQEQVLGLGLNTVLKPERAELNNLENAWSMFARSVRLACLFGNSKSASRWRVKNARFEPPPADSSVEEILASAKATMFELASSAKPNLTPNISASHKQALSELQSNKEIIIKPADKNLGLTVLDREKYKAECLAHLMDTDVYQKLDPDIDLIMSELEVLLKQQPGGTISPEEWKYFFTPPPSGFCPALFYVIMKIHKSPAVGRPIAASHSWCTHHVSEWLDEKLRTIVSKQKTFIKDSISLLLHLEELELPSDCLLATYDVTALYPSIPLGPAYSYITQLLNRAVYENAHLLSALLRWVMGNSFVEFDGARYRQIRGTAMGTPVAPAFATLFMSMFDEEMYNHPGHPHIILHKRYIDDGILIWKGSKASLEDWLRAFNEILPEIKITWSISENELDFLDLHIFKGERFQNTNILDVSTFQKKMNKYLYVPSLSYHTTPCKKGFITSELKRYVLRSSSEALFGTVRQRFYDRLRGRGYTTAFLRPLFESVSFADRPALLLKAKLKSDGISGRKTIPAVASLSLPFAHTDQPPARPLIFKTQFDPLTEAMPLRRVLGPLGQALHTARPDIFGPRIITAWTLPKKIRHLLVRTRFLKPKDAESDAED